MLARSVALFQRLPARQQPAGRAASSVAARLDAAAAAAPTQEAVRFAAADYEWTLRDVQRHSSALAEGLASLGVRPGEAVVAWLPDCAERLAAQFASARLGLQLFTVDAAQPQAAFEAAVDGAQPAAVVVAPEHSEALAALLPEAVAAAADGDWAVPRLERFPSVRLPLTTEFEDVPGLLRLRHVLRYDVVGSAVDEDKVADTDLLAEGTATHADVLEGKAWPEVGAVLGGSHRTV